MFDNLQITKAFKLTDNIGGGEVEVCTFNTTLNKYSGIYQNMNINYPRLYEVHKEEILISYREFNAEVMALAVSMGLATILNESSMLGDLQPIQEELSVITKEVMVRVIESLGNISVNPVPVMDVGVQRNF